MRSLAAIGECMLELRREGGAYQLGYGGDVFNTAVYGTQQGLSVSFVSATGQDVYSNQLVSAWQNHNINIDLVRRFADATPALYAIETDKTGERSFTYWREASPFRRWIDPGDYVEQLARALIEFDAIYYSGISLALLDDERRHALFDLLRHCRSNHVKVAFDPNFRARLWPNQKDALGWIDRAYQICDIALPSIDDERALRGGKLASTELQHHLTELGCPEIVIKQGSLGVRLATPEISKELATEVRQPVDTTAAGDAFNGAYLAQRLLGSDAETSAKAGCELAGQVIMKPGAIVDTD